MRVPFILIIIALLTVTLAIATGCGDKAPPTPVPTPTPVPVYELFNCRELADKYTLQNSHVRRVTDIRIITENRDELQCRGKADVELAVDHDVLIYARRLGSGRISYGVKAEE